MFFERGSEGGFPSEYEHTKKKGQTPQSIHKCFILKKKRKKKLKRKSLRPQSFRRDISNCS